MAAPNPKVILHMLSNPLKHQTQPTAMSCVCTCLAMLMDEPVIDVVSKYHEDYFNKQTLDMDEILRNEGFIFKHELAGRVQTLMPGAIYVLTVASLNIKGGLHQVLVDYRDPAQPVALDPAKGYPDRKYYTVDQHEADDKDNAFLLFSWIVDYTVTDRG